MTWRGLYGSLIPAFFASFGTATAQVAAPPAQNPPDSAGQSQSKTETSHKSDKPDKSDTALPAAQQPSPQSTPQSRNEAQGILQPSRAPRQANEDFQFFGSLRARIEDYNYFTSAKANGAYVYGGTLLRFGVRRDTHRDDFLLELAQPTLINVPTKANAPNPQGALGQGVSYFTSNGGHVASLFPKQLYERFKQVGSEANSLRLGRFEFTDGGEYRPH